MQTLGLIVALICIAVGLVGTLIPLLPGIALIYVGYLVWGLVSGWSDYGWTTMVVLGIVTTLTYVMDYLAGAVGAKKFGATSAGVWGAIIGAVVGFMILSIWGLILGPFVGAVVGEMLVGRSQQEAWKAGWGAFLGFLASSVFRLIIGFIMAVLFLYFLIF
ncbi:MAG: DUF456 domain-containing protein [Calditrichaeota bacterium]|nr:DUF456 domain-containing protein [Calditrichota bacterium]